MTQINSNRNPSEVRPLGTRLQLESGNLLPLEDIIRDLATDPKWKGSVEITNGTTDVVIDSNGSIQTNIYDGSKGPAGLDASTYAQMVIDYAHHETHDGCHFFIKDAADLANAAVFDVQWTTANTAEWAHFLFDLISESEIEWYIYEGATILTPGTALTAFNNNRNSDSTTPHTIASILNTSVANANLDTAVAGATQIAHGYVGAGKDSGFEPRGAEIILRQNTVYCMRAIANAAGYVSFRMEWYDHTDKTPLPHTQSSSSSSSESSSSSSSSST